MGRRDLLPPGPGFAVLVACAGADVVGFAAVAPGQVLALEVEPRHQRGGHGSRLLAAAVDRLRRDGADEVVTWVLDGDAAREAFLGVGARPRRAHPDARDRAADVVERRWTAEI